MTTSDQADPILQPSDDRFVLFPVHHQDLWDMYKKAMASFWTAEEVDLGSDMAHWESMSPDERRFVSHVLAFFAAADGIVNENLALRFYDDVKLPEARAFYAFQMAIETIHAEMYSLLIQHLVRDAQEQSRLFHAVQTMPTVQAKAEWALRWLSSSDSFAERLVAFACVEGIFFSGSFCAIFWLRKRGLMPGVTFSNELISRDEGLHTDFACMLYSKLRDQLPQARVHQIVREAVEVETQFVCGALPVDLIGMNSGLMAQYIQFVADRLVLSLGCDVMYGTQNPFSFMEMISMQGKTNFFERRVGEYQKAGVLVSNKISFDEDF